VTAAVSAAPLAVLVADARGRLCAVIALLPDRVLQVTCRDHGDEVRLLAALERRRATAGPAPFARRWVTNELFAAMPADLWFSPPLPLDHRALWTDLNAALPLSVRTTLRRGGVTAGGPTVAGPGD
jgi:hypothetical protein